MMRTTLTIDDQLAELLQQRVRETGNSFKQVVNDTLKKGLFAAENSEQQAYVLKTQHMGELLPGTFLNKINQVADELEDEAIVAKLELRK